MKYIVSTNENLQNLKTFKNISIEESINILSPMKAFQFDTETKGLDPHIGTLLCVQFGSINADTQVIIDCTTIDIKNYKDLLESKLLIGHNLKFDLQWLYNYSIIPRKIYDTMIVEQLLYLGYPKGVKHYSLATIARERLGIELDKSIRDSIGTKGLTEDVLEYAATDVIYLYELMQSQIKECNQKTCIKGAKLECDTVPAMAYLEWCGIKLDETKWKAKMQKDAEQLKEATTKLNEYIVSLYEKDNEKFAPFVEQKVQYLLFSDNEDIGTYKCIINWSSSAQVIPLAKILGFNTTTQDKKTGEDKDSVLEKLLNTQKGIDDTFLDLYFKYQEHSKTVSSFGQGFLDSINPITGRLHTVFRQLATSSGRLSCGSNQNNADLEKYKNLPKGCCTYKNIQQLPADEKTRSCFISPPGHLMVSADFSAEESRLGADIYQDKEMLNEFLYGSGDMHSLFAWMVFRKECEALGCTCVKDVKSKAPKWRKKVKAVEFAWMFGAAAPTISQAASCTVEEAQQYIDNLEKGFTGVSQFAKKGSQFVREKGYILINPITGHKKYWWDHNIWLERQKTFTKEFWEEYKLKHKGTNDKVAQEVRSHFQAASKYDRDARNVVTQGTGAIIMKDLMTCLFNYIVDNNYFNKIHLCASIHDECLVDYPEEFTEFPILLERIMEQSAAKYCKSLPIPAEASVGDHWIH